MPINWTIKGAEYIYARDSIFEIKYKGYLIVRLKAGKFRENIFRYLSFQTQTCW